MNDTFHHVTLSKLFADKSPDIKRGKRESRKTARRSDSNILFVSAHGVFLNNNETSGAVRLNQALKASTRTGKVLLD